MDLKPLLLLWVYLLVCVCACLRFHLLVPPCAAWLVVMYLQRSAKMKNSRGQQMFTGSISFHRPAHFPSLSWCTRTSFLHMHTHTRTFLPRLLLGKPARHWPGEMVHLLACLLCALPSENKAKTLIFSFYTLTKSEKHRNPFFLEFRHSSASQPSSPFWPGGLSPCLSRAATEVWHFVADELSGQEALRFQPPLNGCPRPAL